MNERRWLAARFARGFDGRGAIRCTSYILPGVIALVALAAVPIAAAERAEVAAAASLITGEKLKTHVDVLADDTFEGREAGSRGGRAAGTYLLKAFEKHGVLPGGDGKTYFQSFNGQSRNILGLIEGSDERLKNEVIIVGAHYDHVGYGRPNNSFGPWGYIHNGADDNASGVAGVLEVLAAVKSLPAAPKRTLLFAFWDAEEQGLIGSRHWLNNPTLPLSRVVFAINLDMIGRLQKSRVEVYGVRTTSGIRRILSEANRGADLELDFNWKMKEDSDHWSFYSRSLPVLMFHTGLHADYHRPSDDAHRVNVEGMQQVSRLVFQTVDQLANCDLLAKFREASRRESADTRARFELPVNKHQPRFGIAWQVQGEPPAFSVLSITPGSPAEKAGVLPGDLLLKLQGRAITDDKLLRLELHSTTETVTFDVQRAGRTEPLQIAVEPAGKPLRVGINWRDDPAEPGATMITQVIHGSAAYYAGLQVRDRVYAINGQEFKTSTEFAALLAGQPSPLEVLYDRNGRMRTVSVPLYTAAP